MAHSLNEHQQQQQNDSRLVSNEINDFTISIQWS